MSSLATSLLQFGKKRSPEILMGASIAGVLASAALSAQATLKASEVLRSAEEGQERKLETKEKVKEVWKLYIPTALTVASTVAGIVGLQRVNAARVAAATVMYTLSERQFQEYKNKVVEKLGEKEATAVHDEVQQDRVTDNPPSKEVIVNSDTDVLFYDSITGRYFMSNVEAVRKAQNDVNAHILNDMYAPLADFYDMLEIPSTPYSQDVGWNADNMLEIIFSTTLSEDNKPCICLDYRVKPGPWF